MVVVVVVAVAVVVVVRTYASVMERFRARAWGLQGFA